MKTVTVIMAALGLASCANNGTSAQALKDENAELTSRVEELEHQLDEARTAADEVESDATQEGLAISSIEGESDGAGGVEVDTSGAELAHQSLESSIDELQSTVAEQ